MEADVCTAAREYGVCGGEAVGVRCRFSRVFSYYQQRKSSVFALSQRRIQDREEIHRSSKRLESQAEVDGSPEIWARILILLLRGAETRESIAGTSGNNQVCYQACHRLR